MLSEYGLKDGDCNKKDSEYFIAIDAFRLITEPQGSISFVVSELVREIVKHPSIKKIILLLPSKPGSDFLFQDLISNEKIMPLFPEKSYFPAKNFRRTTLWIQFVLPKMIRHLQITHFIAPYHQAPIFLRSRVKVITIIHDICGILPKAGYHYYKKAPYRHWFNFITALIRSNAFIYVSIHTKRAFEHLFPYAKRRKSSIIYPQPTITRSINSANIENSIAKWGLENKNYYFAFGAEGSRKGTDLTLEAYRQYQEQGGKKELVLLVPNASKNYFDQIFGNTSGTITLVSKLTNAERDAIYSGAITLIFPSRCEGFGYPILEAMFQGCPPIALHNSPAQEIIGDCVPFLKSLQVDEIVSLMQAYENKTNMDQLELSSRLILRANEFVKQNEMVHKFFELLHSTQP